VEPDIDLRGGVEWHAFLAFRKWQDRLVGRVEAVSREEITLTRMDEPQGSEVSVSWDEVDCIAVCGPDRDGDLFAMLRDERGD
jgi:hypothetical protein